MIAARLRGLPAIVAAVAAVSLAAAAGSALAKPQAYARHGDVMLGEGRGDPVVLTHLGTVSDATLSPDGRRVLFVVTDASNADCDRTSLWVMPARPGAPGRRLLQGGRESQDPKRRLCGFTAPRWSLDAGSAYVNSDAWATSSAVHQVDLKTGAERFVVDGGLVAVIRSGPYRGMLLVGRHKYYPAPKLGSYNPVDVVRPDGTTVLTIPGSVEDEGEHSIEIWLAAHRWAAS